MRNDKGQYLKGRDVPPKDAKTGRFVKAADMRGPIAQPANDAAPEKKDVFEAFFSERAAQDVQEMPQEMLDGPRSTWSDADHDEARREDDAHNAATGATDEHAQEFYGRNTGIMPEGIKPMSEEEINEFDVRAFALASIDNRIAQVPSRILPISRFESLSHLGIVDESKGAGIRWGIVLPLAALAWILVAAIAHAIYEGIFA